MTANELPLLAARVGGIGIKSFATNARRRRHGTM
jgi:hypothetical protein